MALDKLVIKEREDKIRSLNLDPDEILRETTSEFIYNWSTK